MPFLPTNNFLSEDEKKKQQEQQNNGSNFISGESGNTFTLGLPGTTNPANKTQPKQSGSFTNLNKYLDANKEQASQMGSDIAGRVENKASIARQDIYNLGAEKQSVAQVDTNKYLQDPTKNNDSDINVYQDLRNSGGYHGPNDISETKNYFTTQKNVSDASQLVNNAGSEDGRIALLQDQYKRPSYSRGSQILDQTLVQNNEDSKQKFNEVTNKYANLNSLLDGTVNEVGNSINDAKKQAVLNKQAILDAESNTWKNLIDPIQARAAAQTKANQDLISRISKDFSDDKLSDETLKLIGLNEGQKLFDLSLSKYLNPDSSEVGINNIANADERAKYLALQRLIQDPTRTEITADGKAINPLSFDKAQFDKDIAAKQNWFDELAKNTTLQDDYGFEHQGWNVTGHAGGNIAQYLNDPNAISTSWEKSGGGRIGADFHNSAASDAMNVAKSNLISKIEKFLIESGYYNRLKKE